MLSSAAGQALKPWQEKVRCPPAVQDPAGEPALDVLGDALGKEGSPVKATGERGSPKQAQKLALNSVLPFALIFGGFFCL